MENSKASTTCKTIIPPEENPQEESDHDHEEESSWTSYLGDFWCNNGDGDGDQDSCDYETPPSLVSEAASSVTKNSLDKTRVMNLSFKKRKKTKGSWALLDIDPHDHSLEDTATSPVNSPKDKGNNNTSGGHTKEKKSTDQLGMIGNPDSDYTDLKKRGLCLVPVSMLANYLG